MTYDQANCPEMRKLKQVLRAKHIKFECPDDADEPYAIARVHFTVNGQRWSCIHGYGSYGGGSVMKADKGLLELYDFQHEPIGYLTADDVIREVGLNAT